MRVIIFTLLLAVAIIFSFNVNALAVASDYLENNTLILLDGTSKLYGIRLQNPTSNEINIKVTYDSTIAKIVDYQEIYTIPPKTNQPIFFNISAPSNSKPEDTYTISYTVHELSGSGSGVPILLKINRGFKVKIIKNPDKFYISYDYVNYVVSAVIIAVIILVLLLYVFRRKRVKRSKRSLRRFL